MKPNEMTVQQYLYSLIEEKIFSATYKNRKTISDAFKELALTPDECNLAICYKLRGLDLSEVMDIFDGPNTADKISAGESKLSLLFLLMKIMEDEPDNLYDAKVEIRAILNKHFKFDLDEEFYYQIRGYIADNYGSRERERLEDDLYNCEVYENAQGLRMADTRHLTNCTSF